jgi:hypothetical protein
VTATLQILHEFQLNKKTFKKTLPAPTLWLEVDFLGTITNICAMFHAGYFTVSSDFSFFCVKQSGTRNN